MFNHAALTCAHRAGQGQASIPTRFMSNNKNDALIEAVAILAAALAAWLLRRR